MNWNLMFRITWRYTLVLTAILAVLYYLTPWNLPLFIQGGWTIEPTWINLTLGFLWAVTIAGGYLYAKDEKFDFPGMGFGAFIGIVASIGLISAISAGGLWGSLMLIALNGVLLYLFRNIQSVRTMRSVFVGYLALTYFLPGVVFGLPYTLVGLSSAFVFISVFYGFREKLSRASRVLTAIFTVENGGNQEKEV